MTGAGRSGAEPADVHLVRAARDGDRSAFQRLYERYAPMVHGILLARVHYTDVEDLTQDVFVSALSRLATLREPGAFGSWLAAIARNRVSDHHRRCRETVELPETMEGSNPAQRASALGLLDSIRGLPEAYRETLVLRFVEGMTGLEIAERVGMTPASVRVNLHRGVQLLRRKLGVGALEDGDGQAE